MLSLLTLAARVRAIPLILLCVAPLSRALTLTISVFSLSRQARLRVPLEEDALVPRLATVNAR